MAKRAVESVWDYPRPPRVEASRDRVTVRHRDQLLIDTTNALRVLETSHPPTFYLPLAEFAPGVLVPVEGQTYCEFKGAASYYDVHIGGDVIARAAWTYLDPSPRYRELLGMVSLYPGRLEDCSVAGEKVLAQPGDFYGGWITSWITGPFKGGPGTMGW